MGTDQVTALRQVGIEASSINSTTSPAERRRILQDLACGHPMTRLLYVTPEQCASDSFRRHISVVYKQRELSRVAIDEAHCISEWGHDFRPCFKQLSFFRKQYPDVPLMCLTATATPRVRSDIISTLGLNEEGLEVFKMTTSRRNLHYEVRFTSDSCNRFDDFYGWLCRTYDRRRQRLELEGSDERVTSLSGIIYTLFRRDCESISTELCARGIGAKPFHARLSKFEKDETLRGWINDEVGYDIIVATTAFGMGISKENVRFVVHWQIPKSFEGFYQEAGRAGRDRNAAVCCVVSIMNLFAHGKRSTSDEAIPHPQYYSREDRDRVTYLINRDRKKDNASEIEARLQSFQALVSYCESTTTCRHLAICKYFSEDIVPDCNYACDFHKDAVLLAKAKEGLASEEWCLTQRESGALAVDDYD